MNITDEVKKKLEGHDLLFGVGREIWQLGCEPLDLIDHAASGWTVRGHAARWQRMVIEARLVEVRRRNLGIDEVPLARLLP